MKYDSATDESALATLTVDWQSRMRIRRTLLCLALCAMPAHGQNNAQPVRWQAQYTQIYSDNVETVALVIDNPDHTQRANIGVGTDPKVVACRLRTPIS